MNIGTDRILVMGATGRQGGATARELLAAGHAVRVMTRKPEGPEARALAALGAEVVAGDLDDAPSLERSLAGMWGAFAVQNTWEAGFRRLSCAPLGSLALGGFSGFIDFILIARIRYTCGPSDS